MVVSKKNKSTIEERTGTGLRSFSSTVHVGTTTIFYYSST